MTPRRLRVLAIAYACNPYHGSEYGVGWNWVNSMSKYHDLWVVTADFQRQDIERFRVDQPERRWPVRFVFVPPKPWHYRPTKPWRFVEESCLKPIMNLAYVAWQRDAYRLAAQLHRQSRFDLVHLVTFVGFRFPGRFYQLDVPFVWGPIGGLDNTPCRFLPALGVAGGVYFAVRNIINSLQKRFLPGPKRAFRKARGGIVAATSSMQNEILRWYGEESDVVCEISVPPRTADEATVRGDNEPLRIVWSGLHIPRKALPILLRSLARLPIRLDWQLHVLGQGPCTAKWKRMARKLGVFERCTWYGWLSRDAALEVMAAAHVCAVTSVLDLTSTIVVEALAQGLPVICPDSFGFSDIVTSACGVKIPLMSPRQLERDMAAALRKLAENETERRQLASGALDRVRQLQAPDKGRIVDSIYRRAIEAFSPSSSPLDGSNAMDSLGQNQ